MDTRDQAQLEKLIQAILESSKYRAISLDLIQTIGLRELSVRRNLKEAIKATKNKLHQVAGAYLDARPQYERWAELLAASAQSGDPQELRRACLAIMQHHASTRERIELLDRFYTTIFAGLPPVRSLLDVACGLNPLSIPWMLLDGTVTYYACDIFADQVVFLNTCLPLLGVSGRAFTCDLVSAPPQEQVDVALALKVLPPLEQIDKNSSLRLLRALNARTLIVSFPARSLGGRNKGMAENYEQRFLPLFQAEQWQIERFDFPTELVFRLTKS
jgi:16S rRNA (guanine(1405)-N(7))-methyltransferase